MILHNGVMSIIFSEHRQLFHCNDGFEAELHAIMEGMALFAEYSPLPMVVRSNSTTALSVLSSNELDQVAYGHLILDIKDLMVGREFVPMKISKEQNRVVVWQIRVELIVAWLVGYEEAIHVLLNFCQQTVTLHLWNKALFSSAKKKRQKREIGFLRWRIFF